MDTLEVNNVEVICPTGYFVARPDAGGIGSREIFIVASRDVLEA